MVGRRQTADRDLDRWRPAATPAADLEPHADTDAHAEPEQSHVGADLGADVRAHLGADLGADLGAHVSAHPGAYLGPDVGGALNTRAWTTAVVADVAVVVVFATIGRASHDEGLRLAGVWHTAWPFLVGTALALAWAAYAKDDPRTVKVGIRVWLLSLVVGMVLRRLTDAGTAPSFVVVATLVLGALFVGWRVVDRVVRVKRALT